MFSILFGYIIVKNIGLCTQKGMKYIEYNSKLKLILLRMISS